jgi:plastocyanin
MQHDSRAGYRSAHGRLSALALVLALTACTSAGAAPPTPSTPTEEGSTIVLEATSFQPADLLVESGTTVTWQWAGGTAHDVTGPDFASGIQTDGTFAYTFDQPGAYDYWCNLHPGMKGTVNVVSS